MSDAEQNYQFFVHTVVSAWRLVLHKTTGVPPETTSEEWQFTRARAAGDTNPRKDVDEEGFCLFKVGGTFAEVAADLAATLRPKSQSHS